MLTSSEIRQYKSFDHVRPRDGYSVNAKIVDVYSKSDHGGITDYGLTEGETGAKILELPTFRALAAIAEQDGFEIAVEARQYTVFPPGSTSTQHIGAKVVIREKS